MLKVKRSFTLIELLIVFVIIGIITILAIPQYEKFLFRFHSVEAKRVLRSVSDSMWRYYLETGSFPSTLDQLDVLSPFPTTSKYYWYQCELGQAYFVSRNMLYNMEAFHKLGGRDAMDPLPEGVVVMYAVGYSKTPPLGNEQFEKMDHEWYRYYYCFIQGQDEAVFNWP